MPLLHFAGAQLPVTAGETVLECMLRHGHSVPNSCRAGACQSCLMRASKGELPAGCAQPLTSALAEQGYFLACLCRPESDLAIEAPGDAVRQPVTVAAVSKLSASVALLQLQAPDDFQYRAGQYVTLFLKNGAQSDSIARSYSIASLPGTGTLDLHIRRIPEGRFSGWAHDAAQPGDALELQGPAGTCFYSGVPLDQPLLLAGTGTGLAPLHGILQDALRHGHTGDIWLYHGALDASGLYLREQLEQLAATVPNLHYVPATLDQQGTIQEVILARHPKLNGWRGFVCGDPEVVSKLRMKLFLAGIAMKELFADAFLPSTG